MLYLFLGGPDDGRQLDVHGAPGWFNVRVVQPPTFIRALPDLAVISDVGTVAYQRRGRGPHIDYVVADGRRHDGVYWVAEDALAADAFDLRRVEGVPYCWTWRTGDPGRRHTQTVWFVLGDSVDDHRFVTFNQSMTTYSDYVGDADVEREIARQMSDELAYGRLPECFVDGCLNKAENTVEGLWKSGDTLYRREPLGPSPVCPAHFSDLLRLPPTVGPLIGVRESEVPEWLRPYLVEEALSEFDRAIDIITTPERTYGVRVRYRHPYTGNWLPLEMWWDHVA